MPPSSLARAADSRRAQPLSGGDRQRRPRRARAARARGRRRAPRAFALRIARRPARRAAAGAAGALRRERARRGRGADATRRELRRAYNQRAGSDRRRGAGRCSSPGRRARAAATAETYSVTRCASRRVKGENYTETMSHSRDAEAGGAEAQGLGRAAAFLLAPRICRAPIPTPAASIPTGARRRTRPACSPARARRSAPTAASITAGAAATAATRLSTAFDSTTLYGEDPDTRPDIYGRTGNSGVSVATLDDMKKLYSGFDLCLPTTSVSMTINGPAPMILAMFMNTADRPAGREIPASAEGAGPAAQRHIAALHERAARAGLPLPSLRR